MQNITAINRIRNHRKPRYDTTGFRYFSFDVNYDNGPDTYRYYFKARSAKDVARATGVDLEYISECSADEITNAIKRRKHIDVVISGRLVEQEAY